MKYARMPISSSVGCRRWRAGSAAFGCLLGGVDFLAAVFRLLRFFATLRTSAGGTTVGSGGVASAEAAAFPLGVFDFLGTRISYRCEFRLQAVSKDGYVGRAALHISMAGHHCRGHGRCCTDSRYPL